MGDIHSSPILSASAAPAPSALSRYRYHQEGRRYMTETRNIDRPPCNTRWAGRTFDDKCEDCGHMFIQHIITTDARCMVCELLDVLDRVRG